VFTATRNSGLLQSRSDQRPHLGIGLPDFVEKALPRYSAAKTGKLRSPGVLQIRDSSTETVWEPTASCGAFFQGEIEFAGTFGRSSQTSLLRSFVRAPIVPDLIAYSSRFAQVHRVIDRRFSGAENCFQSSIVNRQSSIPAAQRFIPKCSSKKSDVA
jgi:hypothetical protein